MTDVFVDRQSSSVTIIIPASQRRITSLEEVNVNQTIRASRDLEKIIETSKRLKETAKKREQ